jgi:uncharacterized protein (DUF952 family)
LHTHFHLAGRKGTSWTSLYTGIDSQAWEKAAEAASKDESFDEIRGLGHVSPSRQVFPKQIAATVKEAKANIVLQSAEEVAAEKEQVEENERRLELRKAEHAITVARSGTDADGKPLEGRAEKVLADAIAKRDALLAAHAQLAEDKRQAARKAELEAAVIAATKELETFKAAPVPKKSK